MDFDSSKLTTFVNQPLKYFKSYYMHLYCDNQIFRHFYVELHLWQLRSGFRSNLICIQDFCNNSGQFVNYGSFNLRFLGHLVRDINLLLWDLINVKLILYLVSIKIVDWRLRVESRMNRHWNCANLKAIKIKFAKQWIGG